VVIVVGPDLSSVRVLVGVGHTRVLGSGIHGVLGLGVHGIIGQLASSMGGGAVERRR
jgi:hypothetical protein